MKRKAIFTSNGLIEQIFEREKEYGNIRANKCKKKNTMAII